MAVDLEPVADQIPAPKRRGRPRHTEPSPEYVARLEQIVDAAARVFHAKGYDVGSLDDVAEALDLRKASLYHYVDSKAHLLYHVFDRALTTGLKRLDDLALIADPAERLAAMVSHQVEVIASEPSMFAVFFATRPRLEGEFETRIHDEEVRYLRYYIKAVKAAMDAGVIPAGNPRYTAQAVLGMSSWVYKWFDPDQDDWADVCRSFVQLVLHTSMPPNLPVAASLAAQHDSE